MISKTSLGRTEIQISSLGLGAWAIGGAGEGFSYGDVSHSEAVKCIETYLEAGGNHIDTARYYNNSETVIGEVLSANGMRDQVLIGSKTRMNDPAGIRAELEDSLRELKTDVIDIYYIHVPPDDVDGMERDLDVFSQLRDEGKINAIAASIKGPNVTQGTVDLCRQYIDSGRVDAIQLIYSILRQKTAAIFDHAEQNGVGLIGRTSLESGFLTGKYAPGHRFDAGDHRSRITEESLERIIATCDGLTGQIPDGYDNLAQVAIRFAMQPDAISSTIVGATTAAQMERNLQVLEKPRLPDELVRKLQAKLGGRTEEFNA